LLRVRGLALEALRAYDLEVIRCSFVARAFNTVFRVDTTNGSYALRVSPGLRIHAEGCEALEAAWVTALRRDVGLATPAVMLARDGSPVVWASTEGVPEPRSCVLFEWVGGQELRRRMSPGPVRKTGELAAIVNDQAVARQESAAPSGALVADHVLYFRTEFRLDELRPTYGSALDEAVSRAQQTLDALWRNPPHPAHLLHGDISPSNVMVAGSEVTLIDFQDLIWGFEIQEVVIALQGLANFDDFEALWKAFREGYEAIRPWPEADPETLAGLHAARRLNTLNFGLNIRKPGLDAWVARQVPPVIEWMTG
jgi:Ser/Thr protein kinase RdoA (MazF antagonist)